MSSRRRRRRVTASFGIRTDGTSLEMLKTRGALRFWRAQRPLGYHGSPDGERAWEGASAVLAGVLPSLGGRCGGGFGNRAADRELDHEHGATLRPIVGA